MVNLARFFLASFFMTWPLFNLGFSVSGYPMSIPMLCLVCYTATLWFHRPWLRLGVFVPAVLFSTWCLSVTIFRWPIASFVPSLLALFILWTPFWLLPRGSDLLDVCVRWSVRGLVLCLCIGYYQLAANSLGLPALDSYLPVIEPQRTNAVGGLLRLNALMVEPAYLASYLSFNYIVIDCFWHPRPLRKAAVKAATLSLLLMTFSLSGLAILVAYLCFKSLVTPLRQVRVRKLYWVPIVLVIAALFLGFWSGSASTSYYLYRIRNTFLVITSFQDVLEQRLAKGISMGSEAKRLGAISLAADYLKEENVLWGEGYANYENWVVEAWAAKGYSTGSQIHNLYSVVIISVGVVGLILYCAFLASLRLPLIRGPARWCAFFLAWLVAGIATGHLIVYLYWAPLYVLCFAARDAAIKRSSETRLNQLPANQASGNSLG